MGRSVWVARTDLTRGHDLISWMRPRQDHWESERDPVWVCECVGECAGVKVENGGVGVGEGGEGAIFRKR